MPELNVEFRLFFDNNPVPPEQLERVEKVIVEQEIDMMWEANVHFPLRVDSEGNWEDDDEPYMQPFARVRVEVRIENGSFVPIIDGPIVGFDSKLSSEPGKSMMILTIHDDSVRLNQEDRISQYEDQTDDEIASEVFGQFGDIIQNTDVESTPASGSALTADIFQRGSSMHFLRRLARRQGMHAYVLPGEQPGQSIGVFRSLPTQPDGLTPLTLLGSDRNVEGFTLRFNAQRPARVTATTLRITDQEIVSSDSGSDDVESLGDGSLVESSSDISRVILPPQQGESVDIDQATRARAISAGFAVTGSGKTREDFYPDVLSPYRLVTLMGGNSPVSGDYLITRVTHTITRNSYIQSFKLSRNARTDSAGSSGSSSSGAPRQGSILMTDLPVEQLVLELSQHIRNRYYGKYRGLVQENEDPENLGRIRARIPEVLGETQMSAWALPNVPFAGPNEGFFMIPPAGAGVWIEFEAGDVSRPIWSGCWWGSSSLPEAAEGSSATPPVKIIRSENGLQVTLDDSGDTIHVSDSAGNNMLKIEVQPGKIYVKSTTKAIVDAPLIELVEGARHPVVFGDELLTYLNQLVTLFNSHLHPGETCVGIPVTPAPPPIPPCNSCSHLHPGHNGLNGNGNNYR